MRHVCMFSSGAGSAVAARRVVERYGTENTVLLFADVNGEDPDNYRFLAEAAEWVGGELVTLDNQGRTIWDVFHRERYLGNSRIDPCSKNLKRIPMRRWLEANCDPEETQVYLGYDWQEGDRLRRSHAFWEPWMVDCPLMWAPMLDKEQTQRVLYAEGIDPPLLTRQGFPHANCGGGCVKAGVGHFKHLLRVRPGTYAQWEAEEEKLRAELGDVSILRDRRNYQVKPLTLRSLRLRVEAEPAVFPNAEWGGCGCLTPEEPD